MNENLFLAENKQELNETKATKSLFKNSKITKKEVFTKNLVFTPFDPKIVAMSSKMNKPVLQVSSIA